MKTLIEKLTNIWRALLAVFGGSPGFYGERILWRKVHALAKAGEMITLKNDGVQIGERFEKMKLTILQFVPPEGIEITYDTIARSYRQVRNVVKAHNQQVDREYYRAVALYLFTTYGSIICNMIVISKIIRIWEIDSWMRGIMSAGWLIPNTYFIIQLFLYHLSNLKAVKLIHTFHEASADETRALMMRKDAPLVLSVIPAHMEDFRLIRNGLYCHALQQYPNKKIVLLLGNDYYSTNPDVQQNTAENLANVEAIGLEFARCKRRMEEILQPIHVSPKPTPETLRILASGLSFAVSWLEEKRDEIVHDVDEYPTKSFFIENVFNKQHARLKKLMEYCEHLSRSGSLETVEASSLPAYCYAECMTLFKIDLSVFQRYKYVNAEHEKTKAGNLTAYLSLLGKRWHERPIADGKFEILVDGIDDCYPERYVGVFDTDTITTFDYLIRKICFLEKPENQRVGLIQSPYNVPAPEPTISASASGIHSQWFLPISIGMSAFNSAFWLGFNGVFRAKAVEDIGGSFIAETLIEDLENSLKILKQDYTIVTSPEYQCQTFSPPDMHGMKVQRQRWASGGFRIGLIYVRDSLKGKFGRATLLEWFLRLNYILGLNILPLVVTITILLECPYYHAFFGFETLPFFFYILTYSICLSRTSYNIKQYFDGLAVSLFMNFHYLRGTWTSFKVLLRKESSQIFKSTPRSKNIFKNSLGTFEILGICFMIPFLVSKVSVSIREGHYWDAYPLYTLFCIFYGLMRLTRKAETIKD